MTLAPRPSCFELPQVKEASMLTAQAAGSAVTMGCRHGQRATLFVVCERAGMWSLGEGGWLGIDSRARSGDLIHLTKGLWRFVTRGAAGGTRAPRSHWGRSTVYHCPVRYPLSSILSERRLRARVGRVGPSTAAGSACTPDVKIPTLKIRSSRRRVFSIFIYAFPPPICRMHIKRQRRLEGTAPAP